MVVYHVYEASFETDAGRLRYYIGMTSDVEQRQLDLQHGGRQPAWLHAGCHNFHFRILLGPVATKRSALALEALLAARRWKGDSETRGGPWCRPTLSMQDVEELTSCSRCTTLDELFHTAAEYTRGNLYRHLKSLKFVSPPRGGKALGPGICKFRSPEVLQRTFTARILSCVRNRRASGRSGVPGHVARERRGLVYGMESFAEAKWSSEPSKAIKRHRRTYYQRHGR